MPSYAGDRPDDVLDLRDERLGAVDRGAFRQPHRGKEGALILGRQKALRRRLEQPERCGCDDRHRQEAQHRDAHQTAHERRIAVAHAVDRSQYPAHRAAPRRAALQHHRAQRRAQGQRVDGRDQHRDGYGHGELAEQLSADPGNERHRHEHRQENERDRDDRTGNLGHRLLGRRRDRQLGLLGDHPLDILDDDDRVVDDDADGEHERQQRYGIGRVADDQHDREGADDRHRHGDQRDQGRAQPAEEQEHDDRHQYESDDEGADDLAERRGDEDRGVPEEGVADILRKALLQPVQGLPHLPGDIDRVGAGGLVDADRRRRRAVEPAVPLLCLGPEIDARHVLDANDRTVGVGAHDNVLEFLGSRQPALGRDRQLELLARRRRRGPDAAECRLDVLALHGRDDVRRRQLEGGQPVGVEPHSQRVIQRPEQGCLPDAADPRQRVDDVDRRVVVEKQRIVRVLRRIEGDDLQQRGRLLADQEPLPLHLLRQQRGGELGPVLDIDRVDVGVGAEREGDVQGVAAVGAAGGLVVERVVDAIDLLLDGLRDGRLDRLRIGTGVERRQRDLRRHDVRELRHRDRRDREQAGEGDDDRDDKGQPRPVDEDIGDHLSRRRPAAPFPARSGRAAPSARRRR